MSYILYYVMAGVVLNFIYDKIVNYTDDKFRFNMRERFVVLLLWPIVVIVFIYHFINSRND